MSSYFLEFLNKYHTLADIKDNDITDINIKFLEFIEYIWNKDREEEEDILKICTKLKELAAPIESYKLMKADADYYRFYGDMDKYYNRLYYAYSYAVLGYPTLNIEKELKEKIEKIRSYRNAEYFLPLFLNTLGNIYHIYRAEYEEAEAVYNEALQFLINLKKKDRFFEITGRDYDATNGLVANNYIDLILKTEINERKEIKLLELENILKMRDRTGYIDILTELNQAEVFIKQGKFEDAEKVILNLIKTHKSEFKRYVLPATNRLKALIFSKKDNFDEGINYALKSFANSAYYGNTLSEKETFFTIVEIFSDVIIKHLTIDKEEFLKKRGFVDAVLDILSYKDWNLGAEHSANVSQISKLICIYLKLDENLTRLVSFSAMLHDIGKIMIPWFTLNKTEELDDVDWDVIRSHVVEGYNILNKIGLTKEAEIILEHHERIDGSGYPKGTKKPSFESQIVAIADVFDAAVSYGRRYKKTKSYEEIFKELFIREGYEFYPEVLNALKEVIPSM